MSTQEPKHTDRYEITKIVDEHQPSKDEANEPAATGIKNRNGLTAKNVVLLTLLYICTVIIGATIIGSFFVNQLAGFIVSGFFAVLLVIGILLGD